MFFRELQRCFVGEAGVLDTVDAGVDRILDADRAVSVRGDFLAARMGSLHDRAELVDRQFRRAGFGADRQHGAGCDRLDEVGAMIEQVRRFRRRLLGRRRDTEAHVGGSCSFGTTPLRFAAALGDRKIGTGNPHARSRHVAAVDRVAQRDVGQAAIGADVAHARETRIERHPCVARADEARSRRAKPSSAQRGRRSARDRPDGCGGRSAREGR